MKKNWVGNFLIFYFFRHLSSNEIYSTQKKAKNDNILLSKRVMMYLTAITASVPEKKNAKRNGQRWFKIKVYLLSKRILNHPCPSFGNFIQIFFFWWKLFCELRLRFCYSCAHSIHVSSVVFVTLMDSTTFRPLMILKRIEYT